MDFWTPPRFLKSVSSKNSCLMNCWLFLRVPVLVSQDAPVQRTSPQAMSPKPQAIRERAEYFFESTVSGESVRDPLTDPLRGRFPSQRLAVLLPPFICPLNSLRLKFLASRASPFNLCCRFSFRRAGSFGKCFNRTRLVADVW